MFYWRAQLFPQFLYSLTFQVSRLRWTVYVYTVRQWRFRYSTWRRWIPWTWTEDRTYAWCCSRWTWWTRGNVQKTCLTSMPERYSEINVVVYVTQLLPLQLADWSDVVEVNQLLKQHCHRRSHSIHYWRYLCGFWNCESAMDSICRETTCLLGTKKLTPSPHSWDTDDQCACMV